MKRLLIISFSLFPNLLFSQHDKHKMQDSSKHTYGAMEHPHPMSHAFSLNLPMNRNGSGTGWLPDSTPMYGYMVHANKWFFMGHGNVFLRYNKQDVFDAGNRGGEKVDAVNWFMFMGQRRMGRKGLFRFSTMLSFDNVFGGNGYPLLFQTGESWQNKPLVDRQHPHDLFSELSVAYTYAINKKTDIILYAGYPGEPALGSVAFMHRVSSLYNPDAPLSHHWNDGTHITFGVATLGIRRGKFKIEGSSFTGREPDENRYDLDKPRFDSYSGRISFNPNENFSLQVSEAFVKSPEAIHPTEDIYRTTSSIIYSKPLRRNRFLNATALWGLNSGDLDENTLLLEGVLVLNRMAVYSRYEWVQKSREELDLDENTYGRNALFPINAVTVGASYDVFRSKSINMAIGAQGSYFSADKRLSPLYGNNPVSAEVYIRLYPPRMGMNM